ncbi:hypothetical protein SDC9_66865 [bioreactor metagenome]|uniref:Uncharacterized protein n=1 Tax=bioreactor metagenome TaxID=1076179 RepID=A0A644XW69_9ZZZZ
MNRQYVPIVKCKMGEQKALLNLDEQVKNNVIPLIEIPLFSQAMTKKGTTVEGLIASFWDKRKYFFYFMPDWYSDFEDFNDFIEEKVKPLCSDSYAIPVIDLTLVDFVKNWSEISQNGIAIRLRNNEFGVIEEVLNPLFEDTILKRSQTHLIFDLQHVGENDLFSKVSVLKAAFSDLDKASEFCSIVISSVSFPKQFPSMESKKIYCFKRVETEIFATALKLSERFSFNYVYSDYGPSDIEENVFIVGMSPNFKIKYTAFDDYLYIKGIPIKRGGLDIENVRELAKILVDCSDFSGEDYSWGDKSIYDIALGTSASSGNLTTWVSYAMNHHITFITRQI